jgi:hypothetical protein
MNVINLNYLELIALISCDYCRDLGAVCWALSSLFAGQLFGVTQFSAF